MGHVWNYHGNWLSWAVWPAVAGRVSDRINHHVWRGGENRYSALQNRRWVFKKIRHFFVYAITHKQRFLSLQLDGDLTSTISALCNVSPSCSPSDPPFSSVIPPCLTVSTHLFYHTWGTSTTSQTSQSTTSSPTPLSTNKVLLLICLWFSQGL